MKRALRGLLLNPWMPALTSLLRTGVGAAEDAPAAYELPPVVVSASRLGGELAAPTRDMVVLHAAEIAARAPATIADLLGSLPGFDARHRGPWGVQTDLEVEGSTFGQVLILVDGVRANDPQTGHHNLNLPVAPDDLERVEVLYGAGSAVHGPDAIGAVVNLVPRPRAAPRIEAALRTGPSLDESETGIDTDFSLRHGWSGRSGSLWVSAGTRRSDGHREGTGFEQYRGFLQGRLPLSGGALTLQGGLEDKDFGARDFYAPFSSREWTRALTAAATYRKRGMTLRAYGRRHRDRFVLIEENPGAYDNRHLSLLAGGSGHLRRNLAGGQVVLGGEVVRETIDSRNENPAIEALGDRAQVRAGLFGEYGRSFAGPWRVAAGLRMDRHEIFGWEAAPTLSLARSAGPGRLFASAGRAYRAPSFTERYYTDTCHQPNPDLGAERAWVFETGGLLLWKPLPRLGAPPIARGRVEGAVFLRQERDLIDYVRAADSPCGRDVPEEDRVPWASRNLGEMRTLGLRLRAAYSWRLASAEAAVTWVDKEQSLDPGLESKYVFTHPTRQLNGRLRHEIPHLGKVEWQVTSRERLAPLEGYTLIDLHVSRSLSRVRLLVRIRNLTDTRYEAVRGVPMSGRWYGLETQVGL